MDGRLGGSLDVVPPSVLVSGKWLWRNNVELRSCRAGAIHSKKSMDSLNRVQTLFGCDNESEKMPHCLRQTNLDLHVCRCVGVLANLRASVLQTGIPLNCWSSQANMSS
jgi:hypothetical protein